MGKGWDQKNSDHKSNGFILKGWGIFWGDLVKKAPTSVEYIWGGEILFPV